MNLKESNIKEVGIPSNDEKRKRNKKYIICLLSILVVFGCGISYAYLQMKPEVTNTFDVKLFEVKMEETFNPPDTWDNNDVITKEVKYKNIGSIPAVLRVSMAESWITNSGLGLSTVITEGSNSIEVVTKNWNAQNGLDQASSWTLHDGWYYYNKLLNPQEEITVLESINMNIKLSADQLSTYSNSSYKLSFLHEYVKTSEVQTLWAVKAEITGNHIIWNFS